MFSFCALGDLRIIFIWNWVHIILIWFKILMHFFFFRKVRIFRGNIIIFNFFNHFLLILQQIIILLFLNLTISFIIWKTWFFFWSFWRFVYFFFMIILNTNISRSNIFKKLYPLLIFDIINIKIIQFSSEICDSSKNYHEIVVKLADMSASLWWRDFFIFINMNPLKRF